MKKALIATLLAGCLLSACKKEKFDEQIFGRWKITEYYLDNQPAHDTIAKYLEGCEYEIGKTKSEEDPSVNGFIKTYYLGELSYFELKSISDYGISFNFHLSSVPAPQCEVPPDVVIVGGDTASGCFECLNIWDFSFENEHRMEWNGKNTPNFPIQHTHRLVFTKVD